VYLTYTAPRGHALIDRALYLPRCWAQDAGRCQNAGIPPDNQCFATAGQFRVVAGPQLRCGVIPVVADPDPHDHTAAQQRYFTLADTRCPRRTRSGKTDPPHRRITVPQAFWKIVVHASDTDDALRASGFLADQNEALDAVEVMLPAPEAAPVRWESW
jgi:hypothetical protein